MLLKIVKSRRGRKYLTFIILLLTCYFFIDSYFSKSVQLFTNQKAQQFTTRAVEDAIRTSIVNTDDLNSIVVLHYKQDGHVSNVSINAKSVNTILANVSKELHQTVNDLENSKNKELKVQLGYLISRSFFANFGPVITINLKPIGSVKIDCLSSVTPNGINNSILEVYIKVRINFLVLIPMQSQEILIDTNIPLVVEILQGTIPQFHYQGSSSFNPSVSLN